MTQFAFKNTPLIWMNRKHVRSVGEKQGICTRTSFVHFRLKMMVISPWVYAVKQYRHVSATEILRSKSQYDLFFSF